MKARRFFFFGKYKLNITFVQNLIFLRIYLCLFAKIPAGKVMVLLKNMFFRMLKSR